MSSASDASRDKRRLVAVAGGVVIGLLAGLYAISFAYVVFPSAVAPHIGDGIAFALFGTLIPTLTSGLRRPFVGTVWQAQSVVVILLGIAGTDLVARKAGQPTEALFATLVALVVVTSLATGALMMAIGFARLGRVAKSIPYPVIGGFMAATGYFLIVRAVHFGAGNGGGLADLVDAEAIARWAPPLLIGALMLLAERRFQTITVLLAGVLGYGALTAAGILATGMTIEDARAAKLLLEIEPALAAGPTLIFDMGLLSGADWAAIRDELPVIVTAATVAVLGLLMNLTAIEYSAGETVDQDSELRMAGAANVLSGLGGGMVGYASATLTQLAHSLLSRPSRIVPLTSAVTLFAMLLAGPALINLMPRGLFALLLGYLGFGFLWRWLIVERVRMPPLDYAFVLVIMIVTIVAGFAWALLLGVIMASLRFTIAYSRLPVLKQELTGALRLSSAERADEATRLLVASGDRTLIFETQGYMFFGSVNRLCTHILDTLNRRALAGDAASRLIIDFKRVQGVDVSAMFMFDRLARQAARQGVAVVFTGLGPSLRQQFEHCVHEAGIGFARTLDDALAQREEAELAQARANGAAASELAGYETGLRALLDRIAASGAPVEFRREAVLAGARVLQRGRAANSLILLEEGRLFATLSEGAPPESRVATFLPGAVVGEIGFITGALRSASVIAETDSVLRRVTRADLAQLRAHEPGLALELTEALARLLAQRLARTTALLHAQSD